jgi:hypothetical protein
MTSTASIGSTLSFPITSVATITGTITLTIAASDRGAQNKEVGAATEGGQPPHRRENVKRGEEGGHPVRPPPPLLGRRGTRRQRQQSGCPKGCPKSNVLPPLLPTSGAHAHDRYRRSMRAGKEVGAATEGGQPPHQRENVKRGEKGSSRSTSAITLTTVIDDRCAQKRKSARRPREDSHRTDERTLQRVEGKAGTPSARRHRCSITPRNASATTTVRSSERVPNIKPFTASVDGNITRARDVRCAWSSRSSPSYARCSLAGCSYARCSLARCSLARCSLARCSCARCSCARCQRHRHSPHPRERRASPRAADTRPRTTATTSGDAAGRVRSPT